MSFFLDHLARVGQGHWQIVRVHQALPAAPGVHFQQREPADAREGFADPFALHRTVRGNAEGVSEVRDQLEDVTVAFLALAQRLGKASTLGHVAGQPEPGHDTPTGIPQRRRMGLQSAARALQTH